MGSLPPFESGAADVNGEGIEILVRPLSAASSNRWLYRLSEPEASTLRRGYSQFNHVDWKLLDETKDGTATGGWGTKAGFCSTGPVSASGAHADGGCSPGGFFSFERNDGSVRGWEYLSCAVNEGFAIIPRESDAVLISGQRIVNGTTRENDIFLFEYGEDPCGKQVATIRNHTILAGTGFVWEDNLFILQADYDRGRDSLRVNVDTGEVTPFLIGLSSPFGFGDTCTATSGRFALIIGVDPNRDTGKSNLEVFDMSAEKLLDRLTEVPRIPKDAICKVSEERLVLLGGSTPAAGIDAPSGTVWSRAIHDLV